MTAKRQLSLGVVGYGNRGVIAQRAAAADRNSSVRAIYDPASAARERARDFFGPDIHIAEELEELSELDAVFITSPDDAHMEQAVALLDAGVPVFVDKPLAITRSEEHTSELQSRGHLVC